MDENCQHRRSLTSRNGVWSCSDCRAEQPYPGGCSHPRIDNATWQCVDCGERMISRRGEAETVLSAPNAAACTNPACAAALDAGTYDETDAPVGCTNPHGLYIPDRSRERKVVIGWKYTYECERCQYDGMIFTHDQTIWECGKAHRGDRTSVSSAQAT